MSVSLTQEIVEIYKDGLKTFVETGSFEGGGIKLALDCGFERVLSIELDRKYYDLCSQRFNGDRRVELYFGDTYSMMPSVLASVKEPAMIWLDAHYQFTVEGTERVPLLSELRAIKDTGVTTHTILIDDRRLMGKDFWRNVTEQAVVDSLLAINPNYFIIYETSPHAPGDIIVATLNF